MTLSMKALALKSPVVHKKKKQHGALHLYFFIWFRLEGPGNITMRAGVGAGDLSCRWVGEGSAGACKKNRASPTTKVTTV